MNNFYTPFPKFNPFAYSNARRYRPWQQPNLAPHTQANETANTTADCTKSCSQEPKEEKHLPSKRQPVLNIFGIKLFEDDVLILALIYFLYRENIEDNLLIISLFSLLFS